MLLCDSLRHRRVSDVRLGNLVYVLRESKVLPSLRVDSSKHQDDPAIPSVLILCDTTSQGERMPLLNSSIRNQYVVDTGLRPIVVLDSPPAFLPQNTSEELHPGYLVLGGDDVGLSAYAAGGRGERSYWSIAKGAEVDCGNVQMVFINRWRLGVKSPFDNLFVELLAYPKDYTSQPEQH